MSENTREVRATVDRVWDVLSDGWLYPSWVVGASRMRDVDKAWPDVGSRLHHSVGVWPMLIDDYTEVLDAEPSRRVRLRARMWPAGEAVVEIELEPRGAETLVTMREDVGKGPARLVPGPLRDAGLRWRNSESLRRLAYLTENR